MVWLTVYKKVFSPLFYSLGFRCRFEPSCSEYFQQATQKYGPFRGSVKGMWRILRCNSFNPHFGYDPV